MARRDALLRLHKTLVGRRDELRKRLGRDLSDLRMSQDTGDEADKAFGAGSGEVSSQLAQLESRELFQIERAIRRLKQGTYGVCEGCGKKIPVSRLNALPFIPDHAKCVKFRAFSHVCIGITLSGSARFVRAHGYYSRATSMIASASRSRSSTPSLLVSSVTESHSPVGACRRIAL